MNTPRSSIRSALNAGAALFVLGGALAATPAFAQAQEAPSVAADAPDAAPSEEVIVVTGSRIARPELAASSPIQVLGSAEIEQQGSQNISDVLNELPSVGIGTSRANTNFATTGNGVATIDLRNLGENRTLVLINGRRAVSGLCGNSALDINNIPTDLL